MNFNEVKEIIDIFDRSSIKYIDLTLDNCHICMDKSNNKSTVSEKFSNEENEISLTKEAIIDEIKSKDKLKEVVGGNYIKSPIVGTFYASPSPEKDNYVNVGDKVKKGDILCIIESMKLMNEIESDFDGEIAEVLVNNGDIVEYGQNLFRII